MTSSEDLRSIPNFNRVRVTGQDKACSSPFTAFLFDSLSSFHYTLPLRPLKLTAISSDMAERFLAFVLHASAAGIMLAGYKSLETTVLDSYIRSQKGGHAQFLTIQA